MKFLRESRPVVYATVAGALIAACSAGWTAVNFVSTLRNDATAAGTALIDHEQRLRVVEEMREDLAVVKRDVSWIRSLSERRDIGAGEDDLGDEGVVYEEGPETAGQPDPQMETR